jgi:hypothetical protein
MTATPLGPRLRIGGLMRCCIASFDHAVANRALPSKIGATLDCEYHPAPGNAAMRLAADGVWEWNSPPQSDGMEVPK